MCGHLAATEPGENKGVVPTLGSPYWGSVDQMSRFKLQQQGSERACGNPAESADRTRSLRKQTAWNPGPFLFASQCVAGGRGLRKMYRRK